VYSDVSDRRHLLLPAQTAYLPGEMTTVEGEESARLPPGMFSRRRFGINTGDRPCFHPTVMKFAALLVSAVSAATALAAVLDVYNPTLTSPVDGDVLIYHQTYNATWDVSDAPSQITNDVAAIYLRQGDTTTPVILAGRVPIRQGWAILEIPWVNAGSYQLVLFGDSGNIGPTVSVASPNPFELP